MRVAYVPNKVEAAALLSKIIHDLTSPTNYVLPRLCDR